MLNNTIKFPVLIIKSSDAALYFLDADTFGLASKGGESFYNTGILVDSSGRLYNITKYNTIKKAPWLKSLKYFQPMILLEVNITYEKNVTLSDFKELVIKHINTFKSYWLKRDLIANIVHEVSTLNDYEDVIRYLR